ncbi:hypothetical protein [Microbacterium sp. Cr-K29]|uniref:hypothetical protein n=1 Tax=Microbacterium sp. Cr-K29 TaxID=1452534 RepID=UPI0012DF43E3|nr:hypothetical protein [Microbacterium sp. Cr-K29]
MSQSAQLSFPNPEHILIDLRISAPVSDAELTYATIIATGRVRDRLWEEVVRRVRPVLRKAALGDEDSYSLQLELLARRFGPAVERSGGIRYLAAWAKQNIALGLGDRIENERAGRPPGSKVGSTAKRLARALELAGSVLGARQMLLDGGFAGDTSDAAFVEAVSIQAVATPASLSPYDDDDRSHHLEAQVVIPFVSEMLDAEGRRALQRELGLTDRMTVVLAVEFGLDGTAPVTGARALAAETDFDYETVRKTQAALRARLHRLGRDAVVVAFRATHEAVGTSASFRCPPLAASSERPCSPGARSARASRLG